MTTEYLSGLSYRYVASANARRFLAIYNFIDAHLFNFDIRESPAIIRNYIREKKFERRFTPSFKDQQLLTH